MNWFENIKKQVLGQRKQQKRAVFLTEPFKDGHFDVSDCQQIMNDWGNALIDSLALGYIDFRATQKGTSKFHFIKQNGINGFGIELRQFDFTILDWRKFQFFLKHQLSTFRYVTHLQNVTSKSDLGNLLMTYKYYLKPSLKLMTEMPSEQLYGNITIELVLKNDKPFRLLLRANYYSDRNYKAELEFEKIFKYLKSS